MKINVEHTVVDNKKLQDKIVSIAADLLCAKIADNLDQTVTDVIEIKTIEYLHSKLETLYRTSTILLGGRNVKIDEFVSIKMQEHLQSRGLGLKKINEKIEEMISQLKESYDLMFAQKIINAYRKKEGKEKINMQETVEIIEEQ